MGDELSKVLGVFFTLIFVLATLPMLTDMIQISTNRTAYEPIQYVFPKITNPIHKAIIDNMITGILVCGLIFVASCVVYLLRRMYGIIREGAYFES
jgi:hypothetical protein